MTAFVARGREAGIGMPLPITKHVLLQATMAMKLLTLGGAYTCSRPRKSRQQQQKKTLWLVKVGNGESGFSGERMSRVVIVSANHLSQVTWDKLIREFRRYHFIR